MIVKLELTIDVDTNSLPEAKDALERWFKIKNATTCWANDVEFRHFTIKSITEEKVK